ncbi:MAG: methyltransferase domain-containing protein [Oscillospiraceae bacterium]
MSEWDSKQYLKFERERTQPAIDLVKSIDLEAPERIVDIGCGPGNSTAQLRRRFTDAYILGVDNSEDMIETARKNNSEIDFALCDASCGLNGLDGKFDIVFSNACIQWISNHEKLIPEMMSLLKDGGILAVQIPMNYNEPIHKIIGEITESPKWKPHFPEPRIFYTLSPEEYFDILSDISQEFSIWETVYYHKMKSHESIMEWYRGTGLRPYRAVLSGDDVEEFDRDILREIKKAYPAQKNGEIIFKFPRFFFTAKK